jgi:hypothetical protein
MVEKITSLAYFLAEHFLWQQGFWSGIPKIPAPI